MISVPEATPVTTPPTTVALPLLALQVPPDVASVNVAVLPIQIAVAAGDIGAGLELTVTFFVT